MQGNLLVVPGAVHKSSGLLYERRPKRWWRCTSPDTQRVHAAMASLDTSAYILVTPHLGALKVILLVPHP